jgi:hypothetical protein
MKIHDDPKPPVAKRQTFAGKGMRMCKLITRPQEEVLAVVVCPFLTGNEERPTLTYTCTLWHSVRFYEQQ